jgi:hypothetical protein
VKKKKKQKLKDDEEFSFLDEDEKEEAEAESKLPVLTEVDGIELPAAWGQTATNIEEVRKHRQMFNLKHGMFANVPMICKGAACPMHELCTIPLSKRPVFKRCPIEIAAIIDRYDKYCEELQVGPEDYLDQSQVKDLVDTEIKLLRAQGHLAISGDFIEQVVATVDEKGNVHTRPELHKATEYERQLLERKRKILSDLKATRKSNDDKVNLSDPSSFASDLMRRAMKARSIINMPVVEIGDVNSDNTSTEEGEE